MILVKSPPAKSVHFHFVLSSPQVRQHGMDCFQAMLVFWIWEEVTAGQDISADLTVRSSV